MKTLPSRAAAPLALAVLLAAALAAPVASGAWQPQRPDTVADRVLLVTDTADGPGRPLRGVWTVLAAGDTVGFDLPGGDAVRVEIRPVYRTGDEDDHFRLALLVAGDRRLLRRLAPWEQDVVFKVRGDGDPAADAPARTAVGVGEIDRLELDHPGAGQRLQVVNRAANERELLCRVLVSGVDGGSPTAADGTPGGREFSWEFAADVPRIGWDSNAYLNAKTDSAATDKFFFPVRLGIRSTWDLDDRTALRASYGLTGAYYDEATLDETRNTVRVGALTRLGGRTPRDGLELDLAYRFVAKNDTYNGRGDREEFETLDPVTGNPVNLGDRFDYDEHRLEATAGHRFSRRVRAALKGSLRSRDYRNDFPAYPDIYSLDQDQWEVEADVQWRARPRLTLTLRGAYARRTYDEKFARDEVGNELPTVASRLSFRDFGLAAAYGRGPGLRLDAELKAFASTDLHAGYWDYAGTAIEVGGGWRWEEGHRADASLRYSQKDYDRAHVDHDPTQILREKSYLNLRLRGEYVLSRRWTAEARLHVKDVDNTNEAFAYRRTEVIVGFGYSR